MFHLRWVVKVHSLHHGADFHTGGLARGLASRTNGDPQLAKSRTRSKRVR